MIILTAGHTGPNSGAQCAETHFDEGAENIWLRNRIAEILTNKYGLVVLVDDDRASLKLLTQALSEDLSLSDNILHTEPKVFEPKVKKLTDNTEEIKTCLLGRDFAQQKQDHYVKEKSSYVFLSKNPTSTASSNLCKSDERLLTKSKQRIEKELKNQSDLCNLWETPHSEGVTSVRSVNQRSLSPWRENSAREKESSVRNKNSEGVTSVRSVSSVREKENSVREKENSVRNDDFVIDLHFNAHSNPQARGTEAIVAHDATTLELQFATRLAHATADALNIPLRSIKSESETPHRRLGMLHLTPQSIILEVCFCTSPEDVEAYRNNREKLAGELAWAIAELILDRET